METDVLVIGGGATGGGIAWDLALRGVRVILVEMGDLATGTSGRYHGLLHSGGRYAVRDAESAKECIDENMILRTIAPEAIEDTSGFFVLCPGDDVSYVDPWLTSCAAVGIPTRAVSLSEALKRERILNPRLEAVYEVPDGSCDSWDLLHGLQAGARATGKAEFLTYHKVESFHKEGDRVTGARLKHVRTGTVTDVTAAVIINAAGPWAAEVGALAGVHFKMRLSRGAMLAFNIRWVNTVINKLRTPGDGDIFVPVGTVSVIGTTSVKTDDPGDVRVERWEVERILDETEAMTPGISRARILRAWGGVRPLYDPGGDGRGAKRTFAALDHGAADGIDGLISILGGKLTTFRLMAEKVADMVCAKLNVTVSSTTATTVLPSLHAKTAHIHQLRDRLGALEHGETPGGLVCECEIVTDPQIRTALTSGGADTIHDLRRDLRVGMGPCQGGFCAYRAAAIRHEVLKDAPAHSIELLKEFAERRFGGMKPLLWGHNLRQILLAEHLYGRVMGLFATDAPQTVPEWANVHSPRLPARTGQAPRVVVVGAGLAGLTAALVAAEAGARVELVAQGQGALTLHPGWIETGDVEALAAHAGHPYAVVGESLAAGLAVIDRIAGLHGNSEPGVRLRAVTSTGARRSMALTVGAAFPTLEGRRVAIIGFDGWRDFYPVLCADGLRADGIDAHAFSVPLVHGGNFDTWTVDAAAWLDTPDGLQTLIALVKAKIHRGGFDVVGLPAVLGLEPETRAQFAEGIGLPVFEIPTLTPSVPGLRLYHALRKALIARGGRYVVGVTVNSLVMQDGRVTGVLAATAANTRERLIVGDAVILATGGLYGGGIASDYRGALHEGIADLPLTDAPPLEDWFANALMSGTPQPLHRVGVQVDGDSRPVDGQGALVAERLFVAGRLLAGASPISEGATEGIDIASGAHAALKALAAIQALIVMA